MQKLFTNQLESKWGKRRFSEIGKTDVSRYLDKIAVKHPHRAARRLRVMASFFNWCVVKAAPALTVRWDRTGQDPEASSQAH